jgi:signal transduction histidine kinase
MLAGHEQGTGDGVQRLLRQREAEVLVLQEITARFRDHFELYSLLREVLSYARNVLESEASSIVLHNPETGRLHFFATDDSGANLDSVTLAYGQGIIGQVVATGVPRIVHDIRQDSDFYAGVDQLTGFVTRSMLCVPMVAKGQVIGGMQVLNRHHGADYTQHDQAILEIIASQAALAVEFVRANERRSVAERMALVGNMAAGIVHDLRNSLSVILGYADLIALQNSSQKVYTDVICTEVQKVTSFCQELLEYSRGEKVGLRLARVSLNDFVQGCFASQAPMIREDGIAFEFFPAEDVVVEMDCSRMSRVFQNILTNAAQSLEAEGLTKSIVVRSGVQNGDGFFSIEDSGCGMDELTISSLYTPFFSRGKKYGTGLGMAIVKNIVTAHGAIIEVVSTPGMGSTFKIVFKDGASHGTSTDGSSAAD